MLAMEDDCWSILALENENSLAASIALKRSGTLLVFAGYKWSIERNRHEDTRCDFDASLAFTRAGPRQQVRWDGDVGNGPCFREKARDTGQRQPR